MSFQDLRGGDQQDIPRANATQWPTHRLS